MRLHADIFPTANCPPKIFRDISPAHLQKEKLPEEALGLLEPDGEATAFAVA